MSNPRIHTARKTGAASRAKVSRPENNTTRTEARQGAATSSAHAGITAAERHRRISEAAYYRALRRGFDGGSDLEDWLESEAEIDRLVLRT